MLKNESDAIRRIIRVLPINCDWPRLHRMCPGAHYIALVELVSGEYALVPYKAEGTVISHA